MKITALTRQKLRNARVNIFVDEDFLIGVDEKLIVDLDLYKGKEVSAKDIENIRKYDSRGKALESAYRLLAVRPRSEFEICDRLSKKFSDEIILEVVEKLRELKYLDDADFARIWVRERKTGRGRRALEHELKKKGVSKEDTQSALSELSSEEETMHALLLVKKKSRYKLVVKEEAYQKIGSFLAGRGYGYDTIKKVIKEIYEQQ